MSSVKKVLFSTVAFVIFILILGGIILIFPDGYADRNSGPGNEVDSVEETDSACKVFLLLSEGTCVVNRNGTEILVASRIQLQDGDLISTGPESAAWIINKFRKNFLLASDTMVKILVDNDESVTQERVFLLQGSCFYDLNNENVVMSTFGLDAFYTEAESKDRCLGFLHVPDQLNENPKPVCLMNVTQNITAKTMEDGAESVEIVPPQTMLLLNDFNADNITNAKQSVTLASWSQDFVHASCSSKMAIGISEWTADNVPRTLVESYGNNDYIQSHLEYFKMPVPWGRYAFSSYTLYIDEKEVCQFTDIKPPNVDFKSYLKKGSTLYLTTQQDGNGVCYFSEDKNKKGDFQWNTTQEVAFDKDIHLYTHYVQNKFTITFDANGGVCTVQSFDITADANYGKFPEPTRDGYEFLGWYTKKDGGQRVYESDLTTKSLTLYAGWRRSEFTITLDWQTDRGFNDKCSVRSGEKLPESVDVPAIIEGYVFRGFFTDTQGKGEMYYNTDGLREQSVSSINVTRDYTLYAYWEKIPTTNENAGKNTDVSSDVPSGSSSSTDVITNATESDEHKTPNTTNTNSGTSSAETMTNTSTSQDKPVNSEYKYCKPTDFVNVREGPGTSFKKITTLAPNTELLVIEVLQGGWTKIQNVDGSIVGYMSSQYLSFYNKNLSPPTFSVSLSKSVVKIAQYQTVYIKATPSVSATVYWKSENEKIATVSNGMIYGVCPGTTVINVMDDVGNILASAYVSVTGPESVRFAYASENIATVGKPFLLKAITDSGKTAVKFTICINGVEEELVANTYETQSCAGDGVVNTVKIWSYQVQIDVPGIFTVKAYSASGGDFSSEYKEFSCFITTSDVQETTTEERRASTKIIEYIAQFEGFVPVVTPDTLAYNIPTVGYGYVVNANTIYYNNLTREEGLAQLIQTINTGSYASALNSFIVKNNVNMSQAQFDAMVSFNYNLGSSYWNRQGYVFDLKNMILNAVVIPEGYFNANRTGVVTKAAGCNIYADMDRTSTVLKTLTYGESVTVVGYLYDMDMKRGWYRVQIGKETTGYIHCGYVSLQDPSLKIDCNYIDSFAFGTEIIRWHHAGGKCYAGLLYRRLSEGKVFCFGKYEDFSKTLATYKYNLYDFSYPTCMPSYDYKYPSYTFSGGINVIIR